MKTIQVLFLDDEESIIDGMTRLFMREPYGVAATTSVEKAREILAQHNVKVVVSDQRMPDIAGVKFLREVKDKCPDAIRILFTGYTDFAAAEEAINIGEVYRFISKPWKTAELVSTIRQSIEHYDLVLEAKNKTQALEKANSQLKLLYELQKEFTSTVSHELRTPLASIKMGVDLVTKQVLGGINKEQEEVLGHVKSNVDRLKRLIDDILDLTKMESGKLQMKFEPQDLHQLIQDVIKSQKDISQARGLYIRSDFDSMVPRINCDNDRLVQVLNNLLGNAIKFTKQGGIIIKTQAMPLQGQVQVTVVDTGKGIANEDMPKLFQKFQQIESAIKNEEGGTGLGLAICKEIIAHHGGKIWAESRLGEGTSFHFMLPYRQGG